MSRDVQFLPKLTAKLITAAHFGRPLPHSGKVIGKVAKMQEKEGTVTFADGREAGSFYLLMGSFAILVTGPDGREHEYRSSQAILPACIESELALQFGAGATIVEFAFELSQIQHPTKSNLTMWTYKPLLQTATADPLADLMAIAAPSPTAIPADTSKAKGKR